MIVPLVLEIRRKPPKRPVRTRRRRIPPISFLFGCFMAVSFRGIDRS
jgi:hypothetical protein